MSMSRRVATVLASVAAACAALVANAADLPKPTKSGHEAVNGVNYYYAVYGKGEPLLLIHGGLGQIEMFGPNLATLAKHREVIGIDMHGHGRTDLGNRDISLIDMGNDSRRAQEAWASKVDVLGYSLGGAVAFQFAAQHPEQVRRLVLVSTSLRLTASIPRCCRSKPQSARRCSEQMKETPMYKSYAAIAPHPEDFPKLLDQMGAYMRKTVRLVGGREEADHAERCSSTATAT